MITTAITTTEVITTEESEFFFENGVTLKDTLGFFFAAAILFICIILATEFLFSCFWEKKNSDTAIVLGIIIFALIYIYIIYYYYKKEIMDAVYVTCAPIALILLLLILKIIKRLIFEMVKAVQKHKKKKAFEHAQSVVDRYIRKNGKNKYPSIMAFCRYMSSKRSLKKNLKYTYLKDSLSWNIKIENDDSSNISYIEILISLYFVTISKFFAIDLETYIRKGNRFYEKELYSLIPKYSEFFLDENGKINFKLQKYVSDKVIYPLRERNIIVREKTDKGDCYTPADGSIANLKSERKFTVDDF